MNKHNLNQFICMLDNEQQKEIEKEIRLVLDGVGFDHCTDEEKEDHLHGALDSRLCDLEELIDVKKYI